MIINSFYCQTGDESNLNKLYFVEISDIINADKFERLLSFVSEENREKVKRFYFDIDRKLSLYAELIVRFAACKTLRIKNNEIKFEKGEHGKPYLKDYPNFHFNLSHTRNVITVAISDKPVGVDIEKVKAVDL